MGFMNVTRSSIRNRGGIYANHFRSKSETNEVKNQFSVKDAFRGTNFFGASLGENKEKRLLTRIRARRKAI